jgi:hypothetical protein
MHDNVEMRHEAPLHKKTDIILFVSTTDRCPKLPLIDQIARRYICNISTKTPNAL